MQRDINKCISRKRLVRPGKVNHVHHPISNYYDSLEFFCVIIISILISFVDHRCLLPAHSFSILFTLTIRNCEWKPFHMAFISLWIYEIWLKFECFVCQVRFLFSYSFGYCCSFTVLLIIVYVLLLFGIFPYSSTLYKLHSYFSLLFSRFANVCDLYATKIGFGTKCQSNTYETWAKRIIISDRQPFKSDTVSRMIIKLKTKCVTLRWKTGHSSRREKILKQNEKKKENQNQNEKWMTVEFSSTTRRRKKEEKIWKINLHWLWCEWWSEGGSPFVKFMRLLF